MASRPPRTPQFDNYRYSRINNCICATRGTHQKPESESGIGGRWGGTISAINQSEFSGPVGRSQRANKVRSREGEKRPTPARARAYLPLPPPQRGWAVWRARARRPISRAPPPAPPRAPAPGLRRLRVGARHKGGGGGSSGGALEAAPLGLFGPTSLTSATGAAAHPRV